MGILFMDGHLINFEMRSENQQPTEVLLNIFFSLDIVLLVKLAVYFY